jgi:hypothetical protein
MIAIFVARMQQMKPAPCSTFHLMHALWTEVLSHMGFFESVGVCTSLHGWYPMCGVAPETESECRHVNTRCSTAEQRLRHSAAGYASCWRNASGLHGRDVTSGQRADRSNLGR